MDRKMVEFIKEQYPPGTRIRLNSMEMLGERPSTRIIAVLIRDKSCAPTSSGKV